MIAVTDPRYPPGTRVEVAHNGQTETVRAGIVLYVGSDSNVLVGWDDESASVLPEQKLLLAGSVETVQDE
jgi:hypothetical protein